MEAALVNVLAIAVWAWLWCTQLGAPGQIFAPLHKALTVLFTWNYKFPLRGWRRWVANPLWLCPKCHAGQVALWLQVWNFYHGLEFSVAFVILSTGVAAMLENTQQR